MEATLAGHFVRLDLPRDWSSLEVDILFYNLQNDFESYLDFAVSRVHRCLAKFADLAYHKTGPCSHPRDVPDSSNFDKTGHLFHSRLDTYTTHHHCHPCHFQQPVGAIVSAGVREQLSVSVDMVCTEPALCVEVVVRATEAGNSLVREFDSVPVAGVDVR